MQARNSLSRLYTEHAAQFGLRSGSMPKPGTSYDITSSIPTSVPDYLKPSVAASVHKTNRNHRYSPDAAHASYLAGTWTGVNVPHKNMDNYWVQRHIPQSDLQYSWLKSLR